MNMKLSEYFEKAQGIGVLATTDASGQVNQAIYSRPHFPDDDDGTCSFIMSNRLSHDNSEAQPEWRRISSSNKARITLASGFH